MEPEPPGVGVPFRDVAGVPCPVCYQHIQQWEAVRVIQKVSFPFPFFLALFMLLSFFLTPPRTCW